MAPPPPPAPTAPAPCTATARRPARPRSGGARATAGSVAPEGFLQPPGAAVRGDLRVDDQRPVTRAGQPLADRAKVAGGAHGHPGAAEPAPDGGDVGGREADRVQREPARPEVVHLRAVGLIVV